MSLAGCTFGHSTSNDEALLKLAEVMGYEPVLVNESTENSRYKRFRKDKYYEFEDKYGMKFTYMSRLDWEGIDGLRLFYHYRDEVNYNYRIIPFYATRMQELCDHYGYEFRKRAYADENTSPDYDYFGNEEQFEGAMVMIGGYDDLTNVAELMTTILNECRAYAPDKGVISSMKPLMTIRVAINNSAGKDIPVSDFKILRGDELADEGLIYTTLYKDYVEGVKKGTIDDDTPDGTLENTCPEYLWGNFNGRHYDLWSAKLISDADPENPEYRFDMYLREPEEREEYIYHEGYYTMNMGIQNFIAQLGGTCYFHEAESGGDGAGYECYLGDSNIFAGLNDDKSQVIIRRDNKEYRFDAVINNPANGEVKITLSKEDMEEIFDIIITYDKLNTEFIVN